MGRAVRDQGAANRGRRQTRRRSRRQRDHDLQPRWTATGIDSLELIVDGGIKRGTHIIKALALGANACSIGKGYLYGLGAGGQKGVERALELYRSELLRDMALLGCTKISDINSASIRHVAST
jgi:L-lactate dehydrogenase (cytochrome)